MNPHNPVLAIVVPCFNEGAVLGETRRRLLEVLNHLIAASRVSPQSYLLFVDDGSQDATWELITAFIDQTNSIRGLKLSRNCGHQNALLAGLMKAKEDSDCVISIDADLQQDEEAILEFVQRYKEGYHIVYGVRRDRSADGFFKKKTALLFYRLMEFMGVRILPNHADYRLTSREVLAALSQHKEVNLFLRGIFPTLGFPGIVVYHEVRQRQAGHSNYTVRRMVSFALKAITSFSVAPIRVVSTIGALLFAFSVIMSCYVLFVAAQGRTVPGWASTVLPIYFIGGLEILCLGVIGEYVGNIYTEVKRRPLYIVERELGFCPKGSSAARLNEMLAFHGNAPPVSPRLAGELDAQT